jgi:hypothetical protein
VGWSLACGDVQKLRIGLALTVSAVWLVGYVLAYVNGGQDPAELSALMAVVLGWAFAGTIRDTVKRKLDQQEQADD